MLEKRKNGPSTLIWSIFGIFLAGILVFVLFNYVLPRNTRKNLNPFAPESTQSAYTGELATNPLTGEQVPIANAQRWLGKRPLAAMINNHVKARPQAGISQADVVYEIVAEGGITRYLAFFLSNQPEKMGPIRSTREYYLTLVRELGDSMLMHIGWSPQALVAIESWPIKSLGRLGLNCDQVLNNPKTESCWRDLKRVDGNIPWEHTAFANVSELRKSGVKAGWDGAREIISWKFKDSENPSLDSNQCAIGDCKLIRVDFWYAGDYTAHFKYDKKTNSYLKYTGFDENDSPLATMGDYMGKQVSVKNVIVQFVPENPIAGDDKNRLTYELIGSGQALVFFDGSVIKATWSKESRDGRTLYYDNSGKEIEFNRGKFWISVVSDKNIDQVTY